MIRYIPVLLILVLTSAHSEEFVECLYTPKQSADNPYPELELFNHCASYQNGILKIAKAHLDNLDFNQTDSVSFMTSGQYFYVKANGDFLPVITFDNGADYFEEGLTRSQINGKIAFFNRDFEQVIAPRYDWAWPFKQGRALVCNGCISTPLEDGHRSMLGGLWGYIDKTGKEVVPVIYSSVEISNRE
jgi:hypothetical protein